MAAPAVSNELQRLWFATLKRDWSSLAVLPAHAGGSAAQVAKSLAQIAAIHKDSPIKLISAEGADLQGASRLIIDMTTHVASGGLAIVLLDSVISNPAGIPVALAADAALLCVQLGDSDLESSKRTLDLVGASRFVGAVTL
ncbi:MAG: hypothetical protein K1X89_05775 [Myxococcaceae bacterium]|nr:hypothetical protein [Myxococcaceae bacterium]